MLDNFMIKPLLYILIFCNLHNFALIDALDVVWTFKFLFKWVWITERQNGGFSGHILKLLYTQVTSLPSFRKNRSYSFSHLKFQTLLAAIGQNSTIPFLYRRATPIWTKWSSFVTSTVVRAPLQNHFFFVNLFSGL